MQDLTYRIYSFSNFIEVSYSTEKVGDKYRIVKKIYNAIKKTTKYVKYKVLQDSKNLAQAYFTKRMEVGQALSAMWAKAKTIAIRDKVNFCYELLGQAKMEIAALVAKEGKECNRFGSH